jgi:UDP-galactopyranose mutase
MNKKYDFLIIGSGLFGSVCARILTDLGKKCLILEKRNHIGGNCYTEESSGIPVHKYGPHIFHTKKQEIWDFVKKYTTINHFSCRPKLRFKDSIYSFPVNLLTLHQIFGVISPEDAEKKLEEETRPYKKIYPNPKNSYEYGLQLCGPTLYEIFYEGYLRKQWNKDPKEIPAEVLMRQTFRSNFEDSYYYDPFQGIPDYTLLFSNLLKNIEVETNIDYLSNREYYDSLADKVIYTGPIDRFYDYKYGSLEYRSLRFVEERHNKKDYQGTFMISYPESKYEYTRIIEHKHFVFGDQDFTIITKEYPEDWKIGKESYYPVNDPKNQTLYEKYYNLAKEEEKVIFGGRMGSYKYMNMDETVESAILCVKNKINDQ